MSTLSFTAAERFDGPALRSGDDADLRAASCQPGSSGASQVFFAFAGMPLLFPPSVNEPGQGA